LDVRSWDLDYKNLRLRVKISYADSLGLPKAILSQFTPEMCTSAKNCQKPFFWGFKVIDVDKTKKPIMTACYNKQHISTYLEPISQ